MPHRGTETQFELTTIERLEGQGYIHRFGPDLARPHEEVVLRDVLRASLADRYPDLPPAAWTRPWRRSAGPRAWTRCAATWPSTRCLSAASS